MAQVWQALNSLSQTMGNRGGVADAMLRGADATLGLKKAEYDIGRQQKADALAAEERALRMPKLQAEANEFKELNEEVDIDAKMIFPGNAQDMAHVMTPIGDTGKSLYDIIGQALPGSAWNEQGKRVNKDGTVARVTRARLNDRVLPIAMSIYTAHMDPIKKINDRLYETEQSLSTVDPNDTEFQTIKGKADAMRKALSDPNQLATMYAKKASILNDKIVWGMSNNVNPEFVKLMKAEADKAEANYQKYSVKMTKEERQVFDTNLDAKKAEINLHKAQTKKAEAEARKADKYDPEATGRKPLSINDRMKLGENEVKRFSLQYGIGEGLNGGMTGPDMTAEEAQMLKADAQSRGLDVFLDEKTVKDTGSGWNPLDNKDVKMFTVRGIVPGRSFGALQEPGNQPIGAGTPKPTKEMADYSKIASGIKAQYPDATIQDVGKILFKSKVPIDEAEKILEEWKKGGGSKQLKKETFDKIGTNAPEEEPAAEGEGEDYGMSRLSNSFIARSLGSFRQDKIDDRRRKRDMAALGRVK